MATIVTRSGKGSPLTHAEVDANFTNLNTDKLELSGGTMTGNLSFGDNNKAIFGAGSDLQIYHDGSNSFVSDQGVGNLKIQGQAKILLEDATSTDTYAEFNRLGDVKLYYNGAAKLATTSTGIDVTGTVTADGLGIGTTTPAAELHVVESGGTPEIRLSDGTNAAMFKMDTVAHIGSVTGVGLAFDINSTEEMRLTSTGLGIGTSSPSYALDIQDDDATRHLRVFRNASGTSAIMVQNADTGSGSNDGLQLSVLNGGDAQIANLENTNLRFLTNATERMRIDSSGNVGIGTTSPSYKIHTKSSSGGVGLIESTSSNSDLYFKDSGTTYNYSNGIGSVGNALRFRSGDGTERMRIDSSGNVGIGTGSVDLTSAGRTVVQVEGSSNALLNLTDGTSRLYLHQKGGTSGADIWNSANSYMRFATNNTEAMRIDSSGNVGIGTSSPAAPFEVSTSSADYRIQLTHAFGQNKIKSLDGDQSTYRNLLFDAGEHMFETSGTERMRIDSSGNVGIGTNSIDNKVNIQESALSGRGASNGNTSLTLEHATDTGIQFFSATQTQLRFGDAASTGAGSIIYTHSDDKMRFSTSALVSFDVGGSEAMRIDSSRNVGIGTSSPAAPFEVSTSSADYRIQLTHAFGQNKIKSLDGDQSTYRNLLFDAGEHMFETSGTERMRIDSSGNVGIGTSSPLYELDVGSGSGSNSINIFSGSTDTSAIYFTDSTSGTGSYIGRLGYNHTADAMLFNTNATEAMRIDSSGNLLVGTTTINLHTTSSETGSRIGDGFAMLSRSGGEPLYLNRLTSDGDILNFRKDGTTVGSIGTYSGHLDVVGDTRGTRITDTSIIPISSAGAVQDNLLDLGYSGSRFKDLYLSGGLRGDTTFKNNAGTTEYARFDSSGRVGIGTSSPSTLMHISGNSSSTDGIHYIAENTRGAGGPAGIVMKSNHGDWKMINSQTVADALEFIDGSAGATRMLIDSSGNLLVGRTDTGVSTTNKGLEFNNSGYISASRTLSSGSGSVLYANRLTSDGDIVQFRKDGTTVGNIGSTASGMQIFAVGVNNTGWSFEDNSAVVPMKNSAKSDNFVDLGTASFRMDDIYATNGTIQTSDRNEKQDIAELSEAEQRVAVAAKGLLRKFRWRDAVAEKGDEARTHFGIIAQDLQAAFAAEGLDAGDYAMFIHTTWTDEETGEERSRMGVRYSELLAFIIAAI